MAAELKKALGVDATLQVGNTGEFTVWVDDAIVAEKTRMGFPSPDDVIGAVRDRMR